MRRHEARGLRTEAKPQPREPSVFGLSPFASLEVHIEELVLHGFSPADRLRIGAALEGELARLLAERGLPEGLAGGAQVETIDAGSFVRGPLATPVSIGGQVAQAVYGGLSS